MKYEDIKQPMKVKALGRLGAGRIYWAHPRSVWSLPEHNKVFLSPNKRGAGGFHAHADEIEPAPDDAYVKPCDPDCDCCENGSNWGR